MHVPNLDRLTEENNQFFFGTVVSSDAASYSVEVAPISNKLPGLMTGVPLASVMAGMLGMKECVLPQPASTIFCFKNDAYSCLILGVVPDDDTVNVGQNMHARATLGAGDSNTCTNNAQGYAPGTGVSKLSITNANRPTDVVEGEYVVSNEFGVLLGLFQQFAVLKASELAQVQAFLFDDLVRIVSHNFEHFTCMGGTKVYQDGSNLTQEINITHDAKEASGRPNVTANDRLPVIEMTGEVSVDDTDNFFKLKNDAQLPIDRLRGFVGALGDFFHLIFSRPAADQLRALDGIKTDVFDRGLASVKMNMDGSVALRTLGGFAFEKTNWIRVPQRIKPVEGGPGKPVADQPKGFTFDSKNQAGDQPFLHFLQLRDYLAYTMEGEAYRQFADSDKFELNADPSKEVHLGEGADLTPTRTGNFYSRTSGFYAMPNGALVLRDAWGSSIVMEGGNIYIQPAKDLVMQPLRNMIGKVGQNIAIAAQKDIDLSSTSGGFRLKTDLAQYLYSATSGIVMHSDAQGASEYYPTDDLVTTVGGIVLHAPKAGIVTHAEQSLFKSTSNTVIKSSLCMIDATQRVLLRSDDGFDVFTKGDLLLSAGSNLVGFTEGTALFVGLQNTAIGIEKQLVATGAFGGVYGLLEAKSFNDWKTETERLSTGDFQSYSFGYQKDESFDKLLFRFPSSASYQLNQVTDVIPQTLAQQENEALHNFNLKPWMERGVNKTYPYPGADLKNMYATSELKNLQVDQLTQDTYNKAVEHSTIGKIDFTDLFSEYPVYV